MPATPIAQVDAAVERVHAQRDRWVATPIAERIALLRRCAQDTLDAAPAWVEAACRAKGIEPGSTRAGEEWTGGPMCVVRNCRLLAEALEANGQPEPAGKWQRPDGQWVARVFPANGLEKAMFSGITAEVWMEPGQAPTQGRIYRDKRAGKVGAGAVSLVLGAGNVSSIGPMDAFYKLFVEDEVCVIKTNPVNAYLGPFWERSLACLIEAGFVAVVHGGAEVGIHLTRHEKVHSIHITGSDKTHDAIVWGTDPAEVARRKAANDPLLHKPITSELGCVTPVLVVPGNWSDADIAFQARHVAGMVANNASFNCNAAKVLVTASGWPQRKQFLDAVDAALGRTPPRKAYYPGAILRFKGFVDQYPAARKLGAASDEVVPWTVIPDVQPRQGEYALTQEAFCGVLAETALPAADAASFIEAMVPFANDDCWGTLSCVILADEATQKQHSVRLDAAVANLRYGGIGINIWSGLCYGLVSPTWGAFPGHPLDDIRSGRGVVHNTYLFDHPQKSVLRAPFRIFPTPAWFPDHRTLEALGRKMTAFEANPSWLKLPGIVATAVGG
jgi:acyl-CoA reductase-like NAD-dependent aldehyde dehydrogenase